MTFYQIRKPAKPIIEGLQFTGGATKAAEAIAFLDTFGGDWASQGFIEAPTYNSTDDTIEFVVDMAAPVPFTIPSGYWAVKTTEIDQRPAWFISNEDFTNRYEILEGTR